VKALRTILKGLRAGDPRLILWGAALVLYGWMKRKESPELVYKKKLRPGQKLEIVIEEPQAR
jgi:hypothetical protein